MGNPAVVASWGQVCCAVSLLFFLVWGERRKDSCCFCFSTAQAQAQAQQAFAASTVVPQGILGTVPSQPRGTAARDFAGSSDSTASESELPGGRPSLLLRSGSAARAACSLRSGSDALCRPRIALNWFSWLEGTPGSSSSPRCFGSRTP